MKIRGQTVYPLKERLERLSKPVASGCIEWIGKADKGYGKLTIGSRSNGTRRTVAAHRLAYEVHVGPVPDGLEVCHTCDNPSCINVEHLFVGTHQENIADREAKGRNKIPPRMYGEAHVRSKLTWNAVKTIRSRCMPDEDLAALFGVSRRTVSDARRCKTWVNELPDPPSEVK